MEKTLKDLVKVLISINLNLLDCAESLRIISGRWAVEKPNQDEKEICHEK